MATYSSRFLSRPVEESLQQREDRLRLWHLRQQGPVAEFNYLFDSLFANLEVPEDYLAEAYVSGLKEEIANSVRLFSPETMYQARSFARTEETCLQWLDKRARKALKDQEDGGCSQKTPHEVQEVSACPEKNETCPDSSKECDDKKEARGGKKLLDIQEQEELESHNNGLMTLGSVQTASCATGRKSETGVDVIAGFSVSVIIEF